MRLPPLNYPVPALRAPAALPAVRAEGALGPVRQPMAAPQPQAPDWGSLPYGREAAVPRGLIVSLLV